MIELATLAIALTSRPPSVATVAPASTSFDVEQALLLRRKIVTSFKLATDAPVSVPFGQMAGAHVVMMRVVGGSKIQATLTSAEGAAQVVPADPILFIQSLDSPITAIALTRSPGKEVEVELVLMEKAE